uniref:Uncharacterized protein n=1 Tax=Arundo donax TaxID=35708 RepID=A0A0A9GKI2_ARUDO
MYLLLYDCVLSQCYCSHGGHISALLCILIWTGIISTYSVWWFLPSCPFDSLH